MTIFTGPDGATVYLEDVTGISVVSPSGKDLIFAVAGGPVLMTYANNAAALAAQVVVTPIWEEAKDATPYDRAVYVRGIVVVILNAAISNQEVLNIASYLRSQQGFPDQKTQLVHYAFEIAELIADEYEVKYP